MGRELGHELHPYGDVRRTILGLLPVLPTEDVPLGEAAGRVLAEDIIAREAVPSFDSAAMDGYVIRAADLEDASPACPVTLPVAYSAAAGDAGAPALEPSTAQRIMTGAPIPSGGDAVVPHELTSFTEKEVTFTAPVPPGKNLRRAGGDMRPGDVPLCRGMRLGGPQVGVAAALGVTTLRVARRPRVAILSPGAELVDPGVTPEPGQVRNSNAFALAALVGEGGGVPDRRPIVGDDPERLREAITGALRDGADALLSAGGVSAGDYDFVRRVVVEDGRPGLAFKTSIRPGKPLVFGLLEGRPFFGLPGNPAAAIVSFTVFVRPGLRRMLGRVPEIPEPVPVRFTEEFRYKKGRVFLLRSRIEPDLEHGAYRMAGAGAQDSSFLGSFATANAIVELPGDRDVIRAGDVLPGHWIHPW